jgi:hypothetical protein
MVTSELNEIKTEGEYTALVFAIIYEFLSSLLIKPESKIKKRVS